MRGSPTSDVIGPSADGAGECAQVQERYARRAGDERRYSLLNRAVLLANQERTRALAAMLTETRFTDLSKLRLLEVGCGSGMNLVELIRLGFRPEHLQGIDLLPASVERARSVLPPSVRLLAKDAVEAAADIGPLSQDIVYQSTVFTSLLDSRFQERLAAVMWTWVRPGGGVLWYDFTVDNPRNADVRGIPIRRIQQLFPDGRMRVRRVTLAPPLGRVAAAIHPACYSVLTSCTWLRTHALVWIAK